MTDPGRRDHLPQPARIGPGGPDDAAQFARVMIAAVRADAPSFYDADQIASWLTGVDEDLFRRGFAEGERCLVARSGTEIVGFCSWRSGHVMGLYVAPRHARQGLASLLLRAVEGHLRETGCQTARLTAAQNAVAFYLANGWKATEQVDWTTRGGRVIPVTGMTKDLAG